MPAYKPGQPVHTLERDPGRFSGGALLLLGAALTAILAAALLGGRGTRPSVPAEPLQAGDGAPQFELLTLGGASLRLQGLSGQPVWLTFWATSCQPCRAEMPELLEVGREARAGGIRHVSVAVGESPEQVSGYLRRAGYEALPVALDPDGSAATAYGAYGFPVHVFIGADGSIRRIEAGRLHAPAMRDALEGLR